MDIGAFFAEPITVVTSAVSILSSHLDGQLAVYHTRRTHQTQNYIVK